MIARTEEELDEVFRLRYACYRRKDSIDPRPDERFQDPFDVLQSNFSFLVRGAHKEPLATVRITVVNPELGLAGLPRAACLWRPPELRHMGRESYVEASRLCFGPQARRDAFVRLLGNMAALADFHEVKWLVACPRAEHASVYERMFGFRSLAPARRYFGVNFETQLLGIRRTDLHHHVRNAKPI